MRRLVVLLAAGLFACGGRSRTRPAPPLAPARATGGMGATGGMAGVTAQGAGGLDASSDTNGTGGSSEVAEGGGTQVGTTGQAELVPYEAEDTDDSAECRSYEEETDLVAACTTVDMSCRADFASYYALIAGSGGLQYYFARQGCGVTEILQETSRAGNELDFDADGKLIGYLRYTDFPYGPCTASLYRRGEHLGDCPDMRECALAPKAANAEQVCLCACPDPPPSDGIGRVDIACVDRPSRGFTCPQDVSSWGPLSQPGVTGFALTGCPETLVEFTDEAGTLTCIYDDTQALSGARYQSAKPTGCAGVLGWQGGLDYTSCDSEKLCVFGDTPRDATTPLCGPLL